MGEAEKALVRRAATLIVELEQLERKFASNGEATRQQLELYQRVANSLRRTLETTGLQRRAKDITPLDPLDYARRHAEISKVAEEAEGFDP